MIVIIAKYVILFLTCFLFAILQISFLPYFSIFGSAPNLIFSLFFLVIFFLQNKEYMQGFFMAIVAGFFMDVTLPGKFGISIISFLIIYFLHKAIIHFFQSSQTKNLIFYFTTEFIGLFLVFQFLLYLFSNFFNVQLQISSSVLVSLLYSLFFTIIGFYICKKLFYQNTDDNQLKLL